MDESRDDAGKACNDAGNPVSGQAFVVIKEMGDQEAEKSQG